MPEGKVQSIHSHQGAMYACKILTASVLNVCPVPTLHLRLYRKQADVYALPPVWFGRRDVVNIESSPPKIPDAPKE